MVRLADQEMPAIEKIVTYSMPKRRRPVMQGHTGSTRAGRRQRG